MQLSPHQFITAASTKDAAMVISETARAKKSRVEVFLRLPISKITRMTIELRRIDKMKMVAMDGFPAYLRIGRQLDMLDSLSFLSLDVPFDKK